MKVDNSDTVYVTCTYDKVNLSQDYYAVLHLEEVSDPRIQRKWKHMTEGGDKYVIEDYVPPKRESGRILVTFISTLLLMVLSLSKID